MSKETLEVIQLKREQFRWKMRKQALEKGLKEKRKIILQNTEKNLNLKEDSFDNLIRALQTGNDDDIVSLLSSILVDQTPLTITSAYHQKIHVLIYQYLQKESLSNQVVYRLLIFLNDMLYNFPLMFHDIQDIPDEPQQQKNVLQLLSNFLIRNDNQILSVILTLIANLLQEYKLFLQRDESDVQYLIQNFNLFERIALRKLEDDLLESVLYFICTFASLLKQSNPPKESSNIGLYSLIISEISENHLNLAQLVKLYKSLAIILEYSNTNEIELLTQKFHFPSLLDQIISCLNEQEEKFDYLRFYALKSLIQLVKLIDPAWIQIILRNGFLELLITQLKQQPRCQKQALKLIEALTENQYASNQLFALTDQITSILIHIFQKNFSVLILQIFTQVMLISNIELKDLFIQQKVENLNNIFQIFDLYDHLIDFKPKDVLELLSILVNQAYDQEDWFIKLKQEIRKRKLYEKISQLQYSEDMETQLFSQSITDALN